MVYKAFSFMCFLFISFFFEFFFNNVSYTYYFNYISSLNYLDTNILYLFILFFLYSWKPFIEFFFFLFKFFFISNCFTQVFFVKTLLSSLLIGTVLIHPVMFYICLIIFLTKCYYNHCFNYITYSRLTRTTLIIFLTLTMFLGGFWATQSNSWGYFWVNDLVEWVLLFIILLSILSIHQWFLNNAEYNFFYLELLLLNILVFIRLGFLSTRHSFIIVGFSLYIIIYIYLYLLYKIYTLVVYINNYPRPQLAFIFLIIFLFQYSSLLLKFLFFSYFFILFKKISSYIRLNYFHYLLFSFFFIWMAPFTFFKVFNIFLLNLNLSINTIFTDSFVSFFFFFESNYMELLNIVTFMFSFVKYCYVSNFQVNLLLLLTNYQLIYIILFLFNIFRKIGWI